MGGGALSPIYNNLLSNSQAKLPQHSNNIARSIFFRRGLRALAFFTPRLPPLMLKESQAGQRPAENFFDDLLPQSKHVHAIVVTFRRERKNTSSLSL